MTVRRQALSVTNGNLQGSLPLFGGKNGTPKAHGYRTSAKTLGNSKECQSLCNPTLEFFSANLHLSNAELAGLTGITQKGIEKRLHRLALRRNPAQISGILSKTRPRQDGHHNNGWKGGVSKDNYRYKLRQVARYPERVNARCAVYRAIKSGNLERKPCEVCGSRHVQAHHDDYSKPLDVRWLCPEHHRQVKPLSSAGAVTGNEADRKQGLWPAEG